jgi:hypothetical protein
MHSTTSQEEDKHLNMRCPVCHNENHYNNLTCDFCLSELPITQKEIDHAKTMRKIERRNQWENKRSKLVGLLLALFVILLLTIGRIIIKLW